MKTVPELAKRILSALIAAPVFLYATWLGGWYFTVGLMLVTIVIQMEIIAMLSKQELYTRKVMAILIGMPIVLMGVMPDTAWIIFLALLIVMMVTEVFRDHNEGWNHLLSTILVGVIIPALVSGLIVLRNFGDDRVGFILTLTLLLMVWSNDTLAFFGGKTMGKHKLAPKISPAKTIEGFVWGFLGGFLALGLCMYVISDYPLSLGAAIPFAVITGLMGPAGDLSESKLKRASGIKDSSGLMPGHGGLYDRFDAILFSAPAAAVYFYALNYFSLL